MGLWVFAGAGGGGGGIMIPRFLRWCEMDFVPPQHGDIPRTGDLPDISDVPEVVPCKPI